MNQETLQVLIEEVARVALEEWDIRERIGHELGAEEEELQEVLAHLESKLFPQKEAQYAFQNAVINNEN